jgi:hypothetical protein
LTLIHSFLFLILLLHGVKILRVVSIFNSTGVPGEEERLGFNHFEPKNSENWDVQILNPSSRVPIMDVIKHEVSQSENFYGQQGHTHHHHHHEEFHANINSGSIGSSWSHMVPVSSPSSHVTSLSSDNNMLDFTYNKLDHSKNLLQDQISEVKLNIGHTL